jgi:hypothetical protein
VENQKANKTDFCNMVGNHLLNKKYKKKRINMKVELTSEQSEAFERGSRVCFFPNEATQFITYIYCRISGKRLASGLE